MAYSLRAVLFDMDGTLVETEQLWGEAMAALAVHLGGRLTDGTRQAAVGTSMRDGMALLYGDVGIRRTEEQLHADVRWVEDAMQEVVTGKVTWRPGAPELLALVRRAGLPIALVTSTQRRLAATVIDRMTEEMGTDLFDVTVFGDEVPANKPDPAPYRQAMAALGVRPAGCVVVEDSVAGVAAGLASGAAVIAVPSLQPIAPAPGLTLRESLVGLQLAELAAALAVRDHAGTPTG